jgi:hypothetical protein
MLSSKFCLGVSLPMSVTKFHPNSVKTFLSASPLVHNHEPDHFTSVYLLHFPTLYLPSSLPLPERLARTAWELSEQNIFCHLPPPTSVAANVMLLSLFLTPFSRHSVPLFFVLPHANLWPRTCYD